MRERELIEKERERELREEEEKEDKMQLEAMDALSFFLL